MKGAGSESWILLIDDPQRRAKISRAKQCSIEFQILRMISTFQTLKLSNCRPLALKYYQNFKVYLSRNKELLCLAFIMKEMVKLKVVLSWSHYWD